MAIKESEISTILINAFPDALIQITDLAGDQDHYSVNISSKQFNEQSLIKQHRMVKAALADILRDKLHAVTIKTSGR